MNYFEYCAGSVIGSNHKIFGKNNQDAYQIIDKDNLLIAMVCDGCGSGPYSEVGVQLGSKHLIHDIEYHFLYTLNDVLDKVFNDILHSFLFTLDSFIPCYPTGQLMKFINDYLLFTINGCIITEKELITFRIGDGYRKIKTSYGSAICENLNNNLENKPDYIAYNLLPNSLDKYKFDIKVYPIEKINSIVIGTDGCRNDLYTIDFDIFLQNKYYKNPDLLRRYLFMHNKSTSKEIWEGSTLVGNEIKHGPLTDDCTIVAIRRK